MTHYTRKAGVLLLLLTRTVVAARDGYVQSTYSTI